MTLTINDYITATDIKNAMPDTAWTTKYDDEFARLATSASREIDRITHRQPGAYAVSVDETRYFEGPHQGRYFRDRGLFRGIGENQELEIGELADVPTSVSMTLDNPRGTYTAFTTSDYFVWPYNWQGEGIPISKLILDVYNGHYYGWYSWPQAVKVIGKFGFSTTVPSDVQQATLIMAIRSFKRGQQGFQDTGAISELGQLRYVKELDPEVEQILGAGGYIRTVV